MNDVLDGKVKAKV